MKKLTHAAFVAALLVAATFINAPPAAADQLFNGRLISEGPRLYLALQPKGDRECERLNSDAMIQNRAAALKTSVSLLRCSSLKGLAPPAKWLASTTVHPKLIPAFVQHLHRGLPRACLPRITLRPTAGAAQ